MKQIAYPAAVGCGCLIADAGQSARAAEWSVTPLYSSSVDYDSNRLLQATPTGSEATVLSADLRFKRALSASDIFIEPRYSLRRYSASRLGNGDDRSISAGFDRAGERDTLGLTTSLWDQSTLQSEALETGIVSANTQRRLLLASANWVENSSERRQLITQVSYSDVSYHGGVTAQLPGYRYTAGNVGERFLFSERGSVTVSAYGSGLSSDAKQASSHEYGLQAQLIYSFTERTRLDGSVGESSRLLLGTVSHGTDAAITLTHDFTLGNILLSYTRSLVPQGTGYLVERQQYTVTAVRPLSMYLDGMISAFHIANNETAVLLHLERRSYDTIQGGLTWHPLETLAVAGQVAALRTQDMGLYGRRVNGWRSSVTLTWSPRESVASW